MNRFVGFIGILLIPVFIWSQNAIHSLSADELVAKMTLEQKAQFELENDLLVEKVNRALTPRATINELRK
jgi:hypothetical protein